MPRLRPLTLLSCTALGLTLLHQGTPSSACSRVFSNANGQAMVVGRTMDLFFDDRVA